MVVDDKLEVYRIMQRSRLFEQKLDVLFKAGVFYGTTHLGIGQEASHTGLVAGLDRRDWIVPTHRCHGFNIARGTSLEKMFSELFGSRYGICKGLGGSMHMTETATCNAGSSAIVASGVPIAAGLAFALKRQKKDCIAVAIFGDGATSRGAIHETMNLASVWNLPLLFYLENNHYGMSASADVMLSGGNLARRAEGYGIGWRKVDGNDVVAVKEAVEEARAGILRDSRPFLIEVDTYRMCGHSKSDGLVYRSREEEELWSRKDPIRSYASRLILEGACDEETLKRIHDEESAKVDEALIAAEVTKDDAISLRELDGYLFAKRGDFLHETGTTHKGSYRDAIREALDEILGSDSRAVMMGEDIGLYGGCFGVSGDLCRRHPGQILETPVSEEGFTGLAVGASMLGEHPIVEIMYADFSTLASDPLINHAAKTYFMSAGQLSCPLVYRAPIGSGTGHGSQHTGCIESMFLNTPGLIVVAPSDPYTAKALLKSAAKANNPVLFFEHKGLYLDNGDIGDEDTFLPLGKAFVHGNGEDLLIIGYSHAFQTARRATRDIADRITYIDLGTISPIDEETIIEHVNRIGKVLVVEDTPIGGSVADTVVALISTRAHGALDHAPRIVAARKLPTPFSKILEQSVIPTEDEIRSQVDELLIL